MNDNLNPDAENLNTTDKDIERALRPIAFEDLDLAFYLSNNRSPS